MISKYFSTRISGQNSSFFLINKFNFNLKPIAVYSQSGEITLICFYLNTIKILCISRYLYIRKTTCFSTITVHVCNIFYLYFYSTFLRNSMPRITSYLYIIITCRTSKTLCRNKYLVIHIK